MGLNNLRTLYQALVLDHASHPRNKKGMKEATAMQTVHNPSCGDTVNIFVKVQNEKIVDVSFTGSGCTISQASASMLTQRVKDKSVSEAFSLTKTRHPALAVTDLFGLMSSRPNLSSFRCSSGFVRLEKCLFF